MNTSGPMTRKSLHPGHGCCSKLFLTSPPPCPEDKERRRCQAYRYTEIVVPWAAFSAKRLPAGQTVGEGYSVFGDWQEPGNGMNREGNGDRPLNLFHLQGSLLLLQLRVFGASLFQDRNFRVGIFP